MEFKFIHHVARAQPFRDGYFFYRFQEDEDVPALNMHRIWTLPPRPVHTVIEELVGSMGQVLLRNISI